VRILQRISHARLRCPMLDNSETVLFELRSDPGTIGEVELQKCKARMLAE